MMKKNSVLKLSICFFVFCLVSVINVYSQQTNAQTSKKEAYKKQKQLAKKQQANIVKKKQQQNNNKVSKKNNKINKKTKIQNKNTTTITANNKEKNINKNENVKSDEVINKIIDKQIDFKTKKKIKVALKNVGVPQICLPQQNTSPSTTNNDDEILKKYKKNSKEYILNSLIANNISKELIDDLSQNLTHIKETTSIHNRHIRKTFDDFLDIYQIEKRGKVGKMYKKIYKEELQNIEKAFLVDKDAILTIWGMETIFGHSIGSYDAFNALYSATQNANSLLKLEFFEKNFIMLAKLVDKGLFDRNVKSSFDGGLGGCQFMPSSFYNFAVSYNGGKPDIIGNNLDVLASIANYLNNSGWRFNEGVLTEVILPKDFDICKTGFNTSKTIKEWKQLGIKILPNAIGKDNADNENQVVSVLMTYFEDNDNKDPSAKRSFFVYDNFKIITGYNNNLNYCLTAGMLFEEMKIQQNMTMDIYSK